MHTRIAVVTCHQPPQSGCLPIGSIYFCTHLCPRTSASLCVLPSLHTCRHINTSTMISASGTDILFGLSTNTLTLCWQPSTRCNLASSGQQSSPESSPCSLPATAGCHHWCWQHSPSAIQASRCSRMAAHLQKASCQLLDLQFGQQRAGQQWSACMQQLQHLLLPIKLKKLGWGS